MNLSGSQASNAGCDSWNFANVACNDTYLKAHVQHTHTHTTKNKMMHDSLCPIPSHKASTLYTHICTLWGVSSSNSGVLPPRSRRSHKGSNKWSGKTHVENNCMDVQKRSKLSVVGELAETPNQKQNASVLIFSRYVTYICSLWWGYSILAQLWSYQAISSRPCRNHQGPSPHGVLATLSAVTIFRYCCCRRGRGCCCSCGSPNLQTLSFP